MKLKKLLINLKTTIVSNKISAIVFSKDKAAQLKLFLDSVIENTPNVFDLTVIIDYTENEYQKGYEIVVEDQNYGDVNFVYREDDYKNQVLGIMKERSEYFSFFLDDDIIYDKVELADIQSELESDEDVVCFSLRLGENTTKCYTLGADNVMLEMETNGDTMKWDWTVHYLDFGYPFAMDGHIFRRKDIYKLVRKTKFNNVEELEMGLFDFAEMFPRNKMVSYKSSRLVNAPAGRVQQSIEDEMSVAVKESEARVRRRGINATFLSGETLNLEKIDFSNIEGCHQKIKFGGTFDKKIKKTKSSSMDKVAIRQYGKRWGELTKEEQGEINDSIDRIEDMVKQKGND